MNRTVRTVTTRDNTTMAVRDVTVLLVRMTAAQIQAWKWLGDEWTGQDPVTGYEVRDTTGALLGVIVPLGHAAHSMHVEWYDPIAADFFTAGQTDCVLTQGVARILEARSRHGLPVLSGEGFTLNEPMYYPTPVNDPAEACPCPDCQADDERREVERLGRRAA
ncbi:hypothetical protein PH213_20450 [Streptomyces sp. SRF1]|uniref:hypothetical protein n=1 Tax=Streptomyces sp. SRF1 TaxID=1549642 RepID=UPI0025B0746B|nr:hypothetical protein [Streptomyces sp. SRF1]MDN3056878.1 hypothetical protein [Streptomyces sp. SRF1]